ncbi:hypothetical protein [Bradyrhizobium sp. OAE829]|uniref:hypothetical protein n=1 Tax=Bradyrhizobium sp. OAE829 TaxID=2663807 RepID=UPI0017890CD8
MEFRLTYAGMLKAHRDDKRLAERTLHVHDIRQTFHHQLKKLWQDHPALDSVVTPSDGLLSLNRKRTLMNEIFQHDGFNWLPIVTEKNGLICQLEILMLREGTPGRVLYDVDNRLKTLFDALRKAKGPQELGAGTSRGQLTPQLDEDPFYVLLEDDRLITHLAVTTDQLLEPVPNCPRDEAVRLFIDVKIRPYRVLLDNLGYV